MDDHGRSRPHPPPPFVLDTQFLIHDPKAPLYFQGHPVAIPLTGLGEMGKLKTG
ncbi:PIN domain-containing protein, partial [Pseudomonas aeruginosa]|uniref:PIN domain-containing protein n=1 Tax=Pseudomonas aeruginosa TaxID=287 RepID=UPI00211B740A